jgi:hypothetical protein
MELNTDILKEFYRIYSIDNYTKIGYFAKQYGGYALAKKIVKFIRGILKIRFKFS